jgi:hypothetical protein
MKTIRNIIFFATITFFVVDPAYALMLISEGGEWPASWPQNLEPLRKHARTIVGPRLSQSHYAIPFVDREEFESAWPEILKVKSQGARFSGARLKVLSGQERHSGCRCPFSKSGE